MCGIPLCAPRSRFCNGCGAPLVGEHRGGPEPWIGVGLGLLLLFIFPRTLKWVSSCLFHTQFNEDLLNIQQPDGTWAMVSYIHRLEFWADLGPTLFAITLILDGLVFGFVHKRSLLWLMFFLNLAVVGFNLFYTVWTYQQGLAIVSAVGVLIGGYMAFYQWGILHMSNRPATQL